MVLPGFGDVNNSDIICYNILGQLVDCYAVEHDLVAAGVYPITDLDGNLLNQKFVVQRDSGSGGLHTWGFPGDVIHRTIEDNPYLQYVRYVEYFIIAVLIYFIIKNIIK